MSDSDLDLVQAAQAGEASAFGQIYDKYFSAIYKFIYYKTTHKETCEDLTSLTFIKALEKINHFQLVDGNLRAWLFTIARHTVIDYYRTKKAEIDLDSIAPQSISANYDQAMDNAQMLEQIKQRLNDLPPEQKEILILRVWHELSYREIAKVTGKSEGSCKMVFARTVKKIQTSLIVLLILINLINA